LLKKINFSHQKILLNKKLLGVKNELVKIKIKFLIQAHVHFSMLMRTHTTSKNAQATQIVNQISILPQYLKIGHA